MIFLILLLKKYKHLPNKSKMVNERMLFMDKKLSEKISLSWNRLFNEKKPK